MAIAIFRDCMRLALWASGLWLRYTLLQNLIPSFPWIAPPRPSPWRNPRKDRDQILPSGNTGVRARPGRLNGKRDNNNLQGPPTREPRDFLCGGGDPIGQGLDLGNNGRMQLSFESSGFKSFKTAYVSSDPFQDYNMYMLGLLISLLTVLMC